MTVYQAYHDFWLSFGRPARDETSMPTGDNALKFPYITYSFQLDEFNRPVSLDASIWSHSSSWQTALDLFGLVKEKIGAGYYIHFDGGAILIRFGSPMMSRMGDPDDELVRRVNMNIEAEFISA